jgi:hypothetical protein
MEGWFEWWRTTTPKQNFAGRELAPAFCGLSRFSQVGQFVALPHWQKRGAATVQTGPT